MKKAKIYKPESTSLRRVNNTAAVFETPFDHKTNCVFFPRRLRGDFNGVARYLADVCDLARPAADGESAIQLGYAAAEKLLSPLKGRKAQAAAQILQDLKTCENAGAFALLRIVVGYSRNDRALHGDTSIDPASEGRVLSCYNDPVTQGARNNDCIKVENGLYRLKDSAKFFSFKKGDIWRHAIEGLEYAEPFIHRGQNPKRKAPPRLLLIAETLKK